MNWEKEQTKETCTNSTIKSSDSLSFRLNTNNDINDNNNNSNNIHFNSSYASSYSSNSFNSTNHRYRLVPEP